MQDALRAKKATSTCAHVHIAEQDVLRAKKATSACAHVHVPEQTYVYTRTDDVLGCDLNSDALGHDPTRYSAIQLHVGPLSLVARVDVFSGCVAN